MTGYLVQALTLSNISGDKKIEITKKIQSDLLDKKDPFGGKHVFITGIMSLRCPETSQSDPENVNILSK